VATGGSKYRLNKRQFISKLNYKISTFTFAAKL
jgi:hypothetical protein